MKQSKLLNKLHIFGLVGLAVPYPLLSFLRANPAYLLINAVDASHTYSIIILLVLFLPATLILLLLVINHRSSKAYHVAHHSIIAVLIALALLPLLGRIPVLPFPFIGLLTISLTTLTLREYTRNIFTYRCFTILAPVALVLPIHFTLDDNIRQILNPAPAKTYAFTTSTNDPLPPVVMVVFDAFPLVHLLDAQGDIDESRFPHFADLSNESTWYSNATTVHDITIKSIPAMLTGNFHNKAILPLPQNYPGTLFSLLRGYYNIHAFEPATNLSGTIEEGYQVREINLKSQISDLTIFYLRALLPNRTADDWLPLEEGVWGGFLERMPDRRIETPDNLKQWQIRKHMNQTIKHRYLSAKQYTKEIAEFPQNTFHFFHCILPHRPHEFLPSGSLYNVPEENGVSPDDFIRIERTAHILQVGLADTILGELKAALQKANRWDDALVIVVADHGEAYDTSGNKRLIAPDNLGNTAFVPLFIKYSKQKKGSRNETNVQTIDIAPTVRDILGIEYGPSTQGRSLVDQSAKIPSQKTVHSHSGKIHHFSPEHYAEQRAAAHQEAIDFFHLEDPRSDLFNYGPGIDYVGLSADSLISLRIPCQIHSNGPEVFRGVKLTPGEIPTFLEGTIVAPRPLSSNKIVMAIAVNGVVRLVTQPFVVDGKIHFHTALPRRIFEQGKKNGIRLLVLPVEMPATR